MKKLLFALLLVGLLSSCNSTTTEEDIMFLQKQYPKATIYRLDAWSHIVIDTSNIYKVNMKIDGSIRSIVKIGDK